MLGYPCLGKRPYDTLGSEGFPVCAFGLQNFLYPELPEGVCAGFRVQG